MHALRLDALIASHLAELDHAYRSHPDARLRIRALMVLLAAERRMLAAEIAVVVRNYEEIVRRWLVRHQAQGVEGLSDTPRSGAPPKVTPTYRERLLAVVRRRPSSLDLPFSR